MLASRLRYGGMSMRGFLAGLALLGALALDTGSAGAQGGSVAGTWNGAATLNGATYYMAIVFQPNGQFSEQTRMDLDDAYHWDL